VKLVRSLFCLTLRETIALTLALIIAGCVLTYI